MLQFQPSPLRKNSRFPHHNCQACWGLRNQIKDLIEDRLRLAGHGSGQQPHGISHIKWRFCWDSYLEVDIFTKCHGIFFKVKGCEKIRTREWALWPWVECQSDCLCFGRGSCFATVITELRSDLLQASQCPTKNGNESSNMCPVTYGPIIAV